MRSFVPYLATVFLVLMVFSAPFSLGAEQKNGAGSVLVSHRLPDDRRVVVLQKEFEQARASGNLERVAAIRSELERIRPVGVEPVRAQELLENLPNRPLSRSEWDGEGSGWSPRVSFDQLPPERSAPLWGDDVQIATGYLMGTPAVASTPDGDLYAAVVNLLTHDRYIVYKSTNGGTVWSTFFNGVTSDSINYVDLEFVTDGAGRDSLVVVRDGWNSTSNYRLQCIVLSAKTGSNVKQTVVATSTSPYSHPRLATDNLNYPTGVYLFLVYQFSTVECSFRRSMDFDTSWSAILYSFSTGSAVNPDLAYARASDGNSYLSMVVQNGTAPNRDIVLSRFRPYDPVTSTRDTLTVSAYDDFDPAVAAANNDSTAIVVNTHNWSGTGDLDIWYAYTHDDAGTWHIQNSLDTTPDTTTKPVLYESHASGGFYRVVYVRENSGNNYLKYSRSSDATPSWSTATVLSDYDVAGLNSTGHTAGVLPAVSEHMGGGNGRAFYVSWLGTRLYVDAIEWTSGSPADAMPEVSRLDQNYPNPFNPTTKIQFTIVNRQLTIVKVYDLLGREVATLVNEVKEPGTYAVDFDASTLASGTYFCRMQAGDFVATKKLMMLR